jgi:hypothetical protein
MTTPRARFVAHVLDTFGDLDLAQQGHSLTIRADTNDLHVVLAGPVTVQHVAPSDPNVCSWDASDSPCTWPNRVVHQDGLCFGHRAERHGRRCAGSSPAGWRCSSWAMRGSVYCHQHFPERPLAVLVS